MKPVIIVNDIHLRTGQAGKRKEADILEVGLKKIQYLGEIAAQIGASCICCTGDLGHVADWKSVKMFWKVYDCLKALPVSFYCLVGNHDVPGRNYNEYHDHALGYLEKYGALKIIHDPVSTEGAQIWGFHADTQETANLIAGRWKPSSFNRDEVQIALVHAPVGEDQTPWCTGHKSLYVPHFQYMQVGDIHKGFKPYKLKSGCTIVNTGCLVRLKIDEANVVPSYSVIDDSGLRVEPIPHTKPKQAFDIKSMAVLNSSTKFTESLSKSINSTRLDPLKYVREQGLEFGYSELAIQLLEEELKS